MDAPLVLVFQGLPEDHPMVIHFDGLAVICNYEEFRAAMLPRVWDECGDETQRVLGKAKQ
jgi:hypothetical protein